MARKKKFEPTEEELREWNEIEDLVMQYQNNLDKDKETCKIATNELLIRFMPLFKKYILLIKHNQLDFEDMEQKSFTSLFIEDKILRRMLNRKVTPVKYKSDIYQKSNFIKETYGTNSEEDILYDFRNGHNQQMFQIAYWSNGYPFNCRWSPNSISFDEDGMNMKLFKENETYFGGEYRTFKRFSYGYLRKM